jgi:hypothetical protein
MIIILFKLVELPLANYINNLTQCGKVYKKQKIISDRCYILWHIKNLIEVFKILCIINGHMRT